MSFTKKKTNVSKLKYFLELRRKSNKKFSQKKELEKQVILSSIWDMLLDEWVNLED